MVEMNSLMSKLSISLSSEISYFEIVTIQTKKVQSNKVNCNINELIQLIRLVASCGSSKPIRVHIFNLITVIRLIKLNIDSIAETSNKKVFNTSLQQHLNSTGRKISTVVEMCICCLLEKGLNEEGLLRVGCGMYMTDVNFTFIPGNAETLKRIIKRGLTLKESHSNFPLLSLLGKSKLMRMRSAFDADFITAPVPAEYLDVHVVASVLKCYLRSLPEPLLTFELYNEIMNVSQINNEQQKKTAILHILKQLPEVNYNNLRYLMKFLSLLSENNQRNKMSTSNIAIVMSPNLLWARDEDNQDYAQQVC